MPDGSSFISSAVSPPSGMGAATTAIRDLRKLTIPGTHVPVIALCNHESSAASSMDGNAARSS